MQKVNKLAAAMLLTLTGSAVLMAPIAQAAEKCPIDQRQAKAVVKLLPKRCRDPLKPIRTVIWTKQSPYCWKPMPVTTSTRLYRPYVG